MVILIAFQGKFINNKINFKVNLSPLKMKIPMMKNKKNNFLNNLPGYLKKRVKTDLETLKNRVNLNLNK